MVITMQYMFSTGGSVDLSRLECRANVLGSSVTNSYKTSGLVLLL